MSIIAEHGSLFLIHRLYVSAFSWPGGSARTMSPMPWGPPLAPERIDHQAGDSDRHGVRIHAGAYLAGGEVTSTIRKGIIDPSVLDRLPGVNGLRHVVRIAGRGYLADDRQLEGLARVHDSLHRRRYRRLCRRGYLCIDAVYWGKVGKIVDELGGLTGDGRHACPSGCS